MSEKLSDAYTDTENVRGRNVQLEIQFKELEAAVRERDLEIRYLREKMDKEVETIVRERDMVTQRMQEELHAVQGQLAEARQAQANIPSQSNDERVDHFDAREHMDARDYQNMVATRAEPVANQGNFNVPLPRQMVYDGKHNMRCLLGRFWPWQIHVDGMIRKGHLEC